jgi:hypothetical protein
LSKKIHHHDQPTTSTKKSQTYRVLDSSFKTRYEKFNPKHTSATDELPPAASIQDAQPHRDGHRGVRAQRSMAPTRGDFDANLEDDVTNAPQQPRFLLCLATIMCTLDRD